MRGKAMNEFNFSVPQNIIVGRGSMAKLPEVAKKWVESMHLSYPDRILRRWDWWRKLQNL